MKNKTQKKIEKFKSVYTFDDLSLTEESEDDWMEAIISGGTIVPGGRQRTNSMPDLELSNVEAPERRAVKLGQLLSQFENMISRVIDILMTYRICSALSSLRVTSQEECRFPARHTGWLRDTTQIWLTVINCRSQRNNRSDTQRWYPALPPPPSSDLQFRWDPDFQRRMISFPLVFPFIVIAVVVVSNIQMEIFGTRRRISIFSAETQTRHVRNLRGDRKEDEEEIEETLRVQD